MIELLRIENLALVESVELEFGAGLNVLTGETGAGKSIVLSALALLAGGKASGEALRSGAVEGAVEAVFRMDGHQDVVRDLERRGLALDAADSPDPTAAAAEAPPELIVRRTLQPGGRGRARIGGQLVPIATLSELFGGQLEISSQHGSQALRHAETHVLALDAYAAKTSLREIVAREVARVAELDREIQALRTAEEERARRLDFLEYQRRELEQEDLDPASIAALEADHRRLTHAERLAEELATVSAALSGGDDDSVSAERAVSAARRALASAVRMDPDLASLAERLDGLESELQDVAVRAADYLAELEVDPKRLEQVESRIARLEKLRRKYGQSALEIGRQREAILREIETLTGADARIRDLEQERARRVATANETSAQLSRARAQAAKKLAKAVEAELGDLAMAGARFTVALEPWSREGASPGLETGASGRERPQFLFSANAGEAPRPIQRVASGGELSRLFLALKNSLRRADRNMVIVFDEVDAGIGGAVAERVGRVLAELSTEHQVLCITHLPQIAAFADRHFLVSKEVVRNEQAGERTRTRVARVEGEARIDELARMAGGERVTEVTREHARSLLERR
ncbi:MAG: DNA repair protein RecN [Deltaproteobacteria bacterium]|nr:DNA repair protein RecN [Deltaproteobacteria bacterium]